VSEGCGVRLAREFGLIAIQADEEDARPMRHAMKQEIARNRPRARGGHAQHMSNLDAGAWT